MSYQCLTGMVLRVCGELPMRKITRGGVGWGGVGGVGWEEVEWIGMGRGGVQWLRGGMSYQRLTWRVVRACGELPMLNMPGVKSLW